MYFPRHVMAASSAIPLFSRMPYSSRAFGSGSAGSKANTTATASGLAANSASIPPSMAICSMARTPLR